MDNRFIFLYHLVYVISEGGTRYGRLSVLMAMHVQTCRKAPQVNPRCYFRGVMGSSRATANDSIDPTWLEKPRSELVWCPYRKPTLVVTGKYRKGIGTRSAKELGKLAP